MRELHVVGVNKDGDVLTLADEPGGQPDYRVSVDDRVRASVRRTPATRPSSAPSLSPREIQSRLRDGAELDDVAAEAGVPAERIAAYAAPVLSERARVLEDACAARMSRPPLGQSLLPLAESVTQRVADLFGSTEATRWLVRRNADSTWTLQFSYAADGAAGSASWRWDRVARALTPLDELAAELGHVGPGGSTVAGHRSPAAPAEQARPTPEPSAPEPEARDESAAGSPGPAVTVDTGKHRNAAAPAVTVTTATTPTAAGPPRAKGRTRRAAVPAWADVLLAASPGESDRATG